MSVCADVSLAAVLVMVRSLRWRDWAGFGLLLNVTLARRGGHLARRVVAPAVVPPCSVRDVDPVLRCCG